MPRPITLLLFALTLSSCGPPQETRRRIASEKAPLLPEAEDDERPLSTLHAGDLIDVRRTLKPLDWKGPIDGVSSSRSGEVLEVRRADGDPVEYAFAVDLKDDVKVAAARWLCERMQDGPRCAERLRRLVVGKTLIAYDPCMIGPCRVGVLHGSTVAAITIDGLNDLYPAIVEGQPVLIATSRWMKMPGLTGATTYVLRVGDTLQRVLAIDTEEVDSRRAPAIQRMGTLSIESQGAIGVLTFRGSRSEVAPTTGAIQFTTPLVETYHLTAANYLSSSPLPPSSPNRGSR